MPAKPKLLLARARKYLLACKLGLASVLPHRFPGRPGGGLRFGDLRHARPVPAQDHGRSDSADLRAAHAARAAQPPARQTPDRQTQLVNCDRKMRQKSGTSRYGRLLALSYPGFEILAEAYRLELVSLPTTSDGPQPEECRRDTLPNHAPASGVRPVAFTP